MEVFPVHPGAITSRPCQTQAQEALLAMCVVMGNALQLWGGVEVLEVHCPWSQNERSQMGSCGIEGKSVFLEYVIYM